MSNPHIGTLEEATSARRLQCDGCALWYDPGVEWEAVAWWCRASGEIYGSKYCPTCATVLRGYDPDDRHAGDPGDLRTCDPDWEPTRVKHGYPMGDEDA